MKMGQEWRRCASMFIERSEFYAVSNPSSNYIYVFGGTIKQEDKSVIERYDVKEDIWEVMNVRMTEKIPFQDIFNTFCILITQGPDLIKTGFKEKVELTLEMTREEQLIKLMLDKENLPQSK